MPPGAMIALDGPLGAGKTRLVQGFAAELGIDPAGVLSPTFTLVNQYPFETAAGHGLLSHLDAYRVRDPEEFWELGVEELFASGGWTIIEWAERVRVCLPRSYLQIRLELVSELARRAHLSVAGDFDPRILTELTS
jgi:tRNA threonylcarbamoyladenosine biosynthesis protein TsaE